MVHVPASRSPSLLKLFDAPTSEPRGISSRRRALLGHAEVVVKEYTPVLEERRQRALAEQEFQATHGGGLAAQQRLAAMASPSSPRSPGGGGSRLPRTGPRDVVKERRDQELLASIGMGTPPHVPSSSRGSADAGPRAAAEPDIDTASGPPSRLAQSRSMHVAVNQLYFAQSSAAAGRIVPAEALEPASGSDRRWSTDSGASSSAGGRGPQYSPGPASRRGSGASSAGSSPPGSPRSHTLRPVLRRELHALDPNSDFGKDVGPATGAQLAGPHAPSTPKGGSSGYGRRAATAVPRSRLAALSGKK
jgi:hypothetical protein